MRLWSIHPAYLDSKGLVALWREGLLAQKVLQGKTKGYKHHPQLVRFRNTNNPEGAIASYLRFVIIEAEKRGYRFSKDKIINKRIMGKMTVTNRQLEYEFFHLLSKLKTRDPGLYKRMKSVKNIAPHPLFKKTSGDVEKWEIIQPAHGPKKQVV